MRGGGGERDAYRLATELQAAPLVADLEALARSARIQLSAPAVPAPDGDMTVPG